MMLTTKARYAVMAVLELASLATLKPITLSAVSLKQNIPLNYLEQIFLKLKKAGLVKSVRGPGGGYIINAELGQIKIADIIDAVNENIQMTQCPAKSTYGCMMDKTRCKTHYLWQGLSDQIRNYLDRISIADIIAGNYDISRS